MNEYNTRNCTGKWNRSSALSTEIIGILNGAITTAIEAAIQHVKRATDFDSLPYDEQVAALQLLVDSVTAEFAASVESLKSKYGAALQGRS